MTGFGLIDGELEGTDLDVQKFSISPGYVGYNILTKNGKLLEKIYDWHETIGWLKGYKAALKRKK